MRTKTTWVIACSVYVWLVTGHVVMAEEPGDQMLPSALLSAQPRMRPLKEIIREAKQAAPEIFTSLEEDVRSFGYPIETHKVRTEDGYILTMHRIPRGREEKNRGRESKATAQKSRPPVLLQHGMLSHADYWVLKGAHSPGFLLADQGYDVWMNNIRGNIYSLEHLTLSRNDPRFWTFSWHEGGYYDIPAAIDYVLNATKQERLFFIGHSMGNLMFYVAMSMRPEYNAKIRLQIALGPAVYFDNAQSLFVRVLYPNADILKIFMSPRHDINAHNDELLTFNYLMCGEKASFHKLCPVIMSSIWGTTDINTPKFSQITARAGSSTSLFVLQHYAQIILADDMVMMNFGEAKNIAKYGTAIPPKYPLHKVTAPIAIFGADNDYLVPTKGVRRLSKVLPNVVSYKIIHEHFFNHLDYSIHPRMDELLWDDILELMKRF